MNLSVELLENAKPSKVQVKLDGEAVDIDEGRRSDSRKQLSAYQGVNRVPSSLPGKHSALL